LINLWSIIELILGIKLRMFKFLFFFLLLFSYYCYSSSSSYSYYYSYARVSKFFFLFCNTNETIFYHAGLIFLNAIRMTISSSIKSFKFDKDIINIRHCGISDVETTHVSHNNNKQEFNYFYENDTVDVDFHADSNGENRTESGHIL
jgi:predicted membrane protein